MKNQIKRLLMLIILTAGFYSCEKANNNPDEDVLYAKVENASEYSNVVEVKLMMGSIKLASGEWKGDGFTIVLPKTIDTKYLRALINNKKEWMTIIDPPSTVTISNENVKIGNARFIGLDKYGNMITCFYPLEIDEDGNGQDAYFTYVDSDVTISGYTERENDSFTSTDYDNARYVGIDLMRISWDKITTTYLVGWKAGWNLWSFSRSSDISPKTAREKWAPTCDSILLKWHGGAKMNGNGISDSDWITF